MSSAGQPPEITPQLLLRAYSIGMFPMAEGADDPSLFWVDPANDMAVVFFVQVTPFDGTLHRDIRAAVYGADYLGPPGD